MIVWNYWLGYMTQLRSTRRVTVYVNTTVRKRLEDVLLSSHKYVTFYRNLYAESRISMIPNQNSSQTDEL
jgi:hypothetical protein